MHPADADPADPVQEMDDHIPKMNERLQRGTRGWMDGSAGCGEALWEVLRMDESPSLSFRDGVFGTDGRKKTGEPPGNSDGFSDSHRSTLKMLACSFLFTSWSHLFWGVL